MQLSHFGRAGLVAGALVGGALLLGACGSSSTTPPATTAGGGGGATTTTTAGGGGSSSTTLTAASGGALGSLATSLQAGETASYDANYKATESNGTTETVEYASSPPSSDALIVTNSSGVEQLIGTSTHTYVCNQKSGGAWSCVDFGAAGLGAYAGLMQVYQGKFWYQDIVSIKAYAGLAGFSVNPSTMSVAGQSLNCVTWSGGPSGQNAGGEVCVTSGGVLGYVHVTGSNTTFELTSLSTSPSPSKFQVPAGATITTIPGGSIP